MKRGTTTFFKAGYFYFWNFLFAFCPYLLPEWAREAASGIRIKIIYDFLFCLAPI
jgi:hypothetical protein